MRNRARVAELAMKASLEIMSYEMQEYEKSGDVPNPPYLSSVNVFYNSVGVYKLIIGGHEVELEDVSESGAYAMIVKVFGPSFLIRWLFSGKRPIYNNCQGEESRKEE
jgi:hypothetical protein